MLLLVHWLDYRPIEHSRTASSARALLCMACHTACYTAHAPTPRRNLSIRFYNRTRVVIFAALQTYVCVPLLGIACGRSTILHFSNL